MCSAYIIRSEDFIDLQGFPPLGRIADNFSCLILDKDGKKVLDNEVGELCLMGPNIGKGYYNDTERTTVSFVQNPYNEHFDEKMYKTGDLVKYNPDDEKIYFIGRKDFQVKHMGYRIELEEVETALSQLSYISQAAVIHGNKRGLSQLIGIVSTKTEIKEDLIRKGLKEIIPNYMIPTIFHFVSELPKNPNGKTDRQKLQREYGN
jgi:D-alanine--poly(phosphoribitol) ligase subunit 1